MSKAPAFAVVPHTEPTRGSEMEAVPLLFRTDLQKHKCTWCHHPHNCYSARQIFQSARKFDIIWCPPPPPWLHHALMFWTVFVFVHVRRGTCGVRTCSLILTWGDGSIRAKRKARESQKYSRAQHYSQTQFDSWAQTDSEAQPDSWPNLILRPGMILRTTTFLSVVTFVY